MTEEQKQELFAQIDESQYAEIKRYVLRLVRRSALAEDLTQETFLRWMESGRSVPLENRRAWLYRTARNLVYDHFRREKCWTDIQNALTYHRTSDASDDLLDSLEKKETQTMLLSKLNDLPPRQREAVRLKFQEKLTYDEIAQVMGESRSTVGWLLHEALTKLRLWMENNQEGGNLK